MRALVIDDSRPIRRIESDILRELGFETSDACNGKEALDQLESAPPPSLVLVDWNMPEMNGLDFVRAVRGNAELGALPLMMVTTETEIEQMAKALEAGANEYVMKPFGKECIADKLALLGVLTQD